MPFEVLAIIANGAFAVLMLYRARQQYLEGVRQIEEYGLEVAKMRCFTGWLVETKLGAEVDHETLFEEFEPMWNDFYEKAHKTYYENMAEISKQ